MYVHMYVCTSLSLVESTVVVRLFLPVRWNLRVLLTKKDIWHFTRNRNAPFNGIIVTLIFGTIQGKTSYLSRIVAKNIFQISSLGAFMLQVTLWILYIQSDYETFFVEQNKQKTRPSNVNWSVRESIQLFQKLNHSNTLYLQIANT